MRKRRLSLFYGRVLWLTRPGRAVLHCFFGPRYIGPNQNYRIPSHAVRRSYEILRMLDAFRTDPERARWLQLMLEEHMESPY